MSARIHFIVTGELESTLEASLLGGGVHPDIPVQQRDPYGYPADIHRRDGSVSRGLMVPAPVWLLEGASSLMLVDTGLGDVAEVASMHDRHGTTQWAVERKPGQDIVSGLAAHGVRPTDIDFVLLSHLHYDHVGNNELFTNARFVVQRDELTLALCPPRFSMFYYPEYAHQMIDVLDRCEIIDGDHQVDPAVRLVKVGGHTPGSQATIVETDAGRVCLAGDVLYNYRNIELDWPIGSYWNLGELLRGVARLRQDADILVPQHDWQFLQVFPTGTIG